MHATQPFLLFLFVSFFFYNCFILWVGWKWVGSVVFRILNAFLLTKDSIVLADAFCLLGQVQLFHSISE